MTLPESHSAPLADPEIPDTEVILVPEPARVFVDTTGRRRRLLRRAAYAVGAFCMVYGGIVVVSLAGGPVSPHAVLPIPDLIERRHQDPVRRPPATAPAPAPAAPREQGTAGLARDRFAPRTPNPRTGRTTTPGTVRAGGAGGSPRSPRPVLEASPTPGISPGATPRSEQPTASPSGSPTPTPTATGPEEGGTGAGDGTAVPIGAGPTDPTCSAGTSADRSA